MEVEVTRVTKVFRTKTERVRALDEVSFLCPSGKVLTLLGPSGCGKTTLLRCIAGLEEPDSGEIRLGERLVWSKEKGVSVPPERRGIGMVFQSYAIWPHMTVYENVAFPLRVKRVPRQEIAKRVRAVLEMVQLSGLENRPATRLSGGQQQRVALARALVSEPKVLLFDEPLSNLDAKLREATRHELRAFLSHLKITAIYVTHDRAEALAISDEIAVMNQGKIVARGTPKELYFFAEDPFVVDFIGRANFLKGTLVGYNQEGFAQVRFPFGVLRCVGQGFPLGTEVTVIIRPESFSLSGEGGNVLSGRVISAIFTGEDYEVRVSLDEHTVVLAKLEATVPAIPQPGEEIELKVMPQWCRVLRA
jgi:iron(III) transport system ATP-binding protein